VEGLRRVRRQKLKPEEKKCQHNTHAVGILEKVSVFTRQFEQKFGIRPRNSQLNFLDSFSKHIPSRFKLIFFPQLKLPNDLISLLHLVLIKLLICVLILCSLFE
jgi:hypothetical protein